MIYIFPDVVAMIEVFLIGLVVALIGAGGTSFLYTPCTPTETHVSARSTTKTLGKLSLRRKKIKTQKSQEFQKVC